MKNKYNLGQFYHSFSEPATGIAFSRESLNIGVFHILKDKHKITSGELSHPFYTINIESLVKLWNQETALRFLDLERCKPPSLGTPLESDAS